MLEDTSFTVSNEKNDVFSRHHKPLQYFVFSRIFFIDRERHFRFNKSEVGATYMLAGSHKSPGIGLSLLVSAIGPWALWRTWPARR